VKRVFWEKWVSRVFELTSFALRGEQKFSSGLRGKKMTFSDFRAGHF